MQRGRPARLRLGLRSPGAGGRGHVCSGATAQPRPPPLTEPVISSLPTAPGATSGQSMFLKFFTD